MGQTKRTIRKNASIDRARTHLPAAGTEQAKVSNQAEQSSRPGRCGTKRQSRINKHRAVLACDLDGKSHTHRLSLTRTSHGRQADARCGGACRAKRRRKVVDSDSRRVQGSGLAAAAAVSGVE